jgi:hypothetical protein
MEHAIRPLGAWGNPDPSERQESHRDRDCAGGVVMPPRQQAAACPLCGKTLILIGATTVHRDGADGIWCALLNPARTP